MRVPCVELRQGAHRTTDLQEIAVGIAEIEGFDNLVLDLEQNRYAISLELCTPCSQLCDALDAPCCVDGITVEAGAMDQVIRLLMAQIIKKGDCAAGAALKKEVEKIGVVGWPPTSCGYRMHQRQFEHVAIKLDRFAQFPGGASGVMHAVQAQSFGHCHIPFSQASNCREGRESAGR